MPLIENAFTPLGKTVFLPLGLNWCNRDAAFQKKNDGFSKAKISWKLLNIYDKYMLNIYRIRIGFIWNRSLLKQMEMKEKKIWKTETLLIFWRQCLGC